MKEFPSDKMLNYCYLTIPMLPKANIEYFKRSKNKLVNQYVSIPTP